MALDYRHILTLLGCGVGTKIPTANAENEELEIQVCKEKCFFSRYSFTRSCEQDILLHSPALNLQGPISTGECGRVSLS